MTFKTRPHTVKTFNISPKTLILAVRDLFFVSGRCNIGVPELETFSGGACGGVIAIRRKGSGYTIRNGPKPKIVLEEILAPFRLMCRPATPGEAGGLREICARPIGQVSGLKAAQGYIACYLYLVFSAAWGANGRANTLRF